MSWEVIRVFEKIDKKVLDDIIDGLDRPGYRNAVVGAAEEAVKLLKERDRAVELLREIANSNGFTRGQVNDSRPMILAPCVFDLDSGGVERLIRFLRGLEGE